MALMGALLMSGFLVGFLTAPWFAKEPAPRFLIRVPPLEHFMGWTSFSELEQTKSMLRALCLRTVAEIRAQYLQTRSPLTGTTEPIAVLRDRGLSTAIVEIRSQLESFAGSDPEDLLQGELLRFLEKAGREDEWLDAYLAVLYQQPTEAVVEEYRARALAIGCATDREPEVAAALEHLDSIPRAYRPTPKPTPAPVDEPEPGWTNYTP